MLAPPATQHHTFFCSFFSSRRRHTIFQGDWSSDVCSSDLLAWAFLPITPAAVGPKPRRGGRRLPRSEEHTSELQSPCHLMCRLLLEKKESHIRSPSRLAGSSWAWSSRGQRARGRQACAVGCRGPAERPEPGRCPEVCFFFFNAAGCPEFSPFPLPGVLRT